VARIILHVDLDAFYVSVEVRGRPELKGKPVIVGADPKGGKGRGVVMASSYEARALGVKSAMPISQAWKKAPNAVYLPPDFDTYVATSENVMNILREFADKFEQASIDEAYLDVTSRTSWAEVRDFAMAVKKAIRDREGLGCSVGAAPNKSTAKIAAGIEKPDGLTVVPPEKVRQFLAPLPVGAISGVGEKTARVLEEVGVHTIGDLAAFPGGELVAKLGRNAVWLWGIAQGIEEMPVEERGEPKSISVERTFNRDIESWDEIVQTLDSIADNVHLRVKDARVEFKTVSIKIRFSGFETHTRERTLSAWSQERSVLVDTARQLIAEFSTAERPVRLIGVRVAELRKVKGRQASLPV